MIIKNSFWIKALDLEKIYWSKDENEKEKIWENLKTKVPESQKERYLKVLDKMIFKKRIWNERFENLILENILNLSDLGTKLQENEINFWTNIFTESLFKKLRSENKFIKIIKNADLEELKFSLENVEDRYLIRYEILKKRNQLNLLHMLWDPINSESIKYFLKKIDFCIENNLEMIIFVEENFIYFEHKISTNILKRFILAFTSFFVFMIIFFHLSNFWVNFMSSDRLKLEKDWSFRYCKKNFEYDKEFYDRNLKQCEKYEKFYNLEFTELDKKLIVFREWEFDYDWGTISYESIICIILAFFSTKFFLNFLEKRTMKFI